jgi:ubiquinone/menaquinone biosynthesis C-methylase UbiE
LPVYPDIIKRLKDGQAFLDIGCCFGQVIRKLVYDGVPSENIYGADFREDFIELGHELFRDKATLRTKFIIGDGKTLTTRDDKREGAERC